ncbi:MAG: hypothetical protein HWD61_03065 [Parachlamydiaceae bacterium]|nr:MAG: hypothetical protein HWD61_03065 [Parachlamydiaceae bacterium]
MANDLRNWNSAFTKSYSTSGFEYAFNEIEVRLELKDKVLGFFPFKDKDICVYTEAKIKDLKFVKYVLIRRPKKKKQRIPKKKKQRIPKKKKQRIPKKKKQRVPKKRSKEYQRKEVKTIKEKN